jgi:hypothetical protein
MNAGAVLMGLAATIAAVAYIARPFRKVPGVDQEIESWLATLRAARSQDEPQPFAVPTLQAEPMVPAESDVAFCHQCGRPVRPHHRFCPRCGAGLGEGEV